MVEELRQDNITDDEQLESSDDEEFLEEPRLDVLDQYGIQDPDPRKRGHRKGRMPAGLARYWAKHRRGGASKYYSLYDPRHRRVHHRRHDPRRRSSPRTRTVYKTRYRTRSMPRFHPAYRRRLKKGLFDPAITGIGGSHAAFWGAVLQPIVTTIGGMAHNYAVTRFPSLGGGYKVGQGAVGYLGLAGGIVGSFLDMKNSQFGNLANAFGSGMLSEAVNMPWAEGVATVPTQNAYAGAARKGGRGQPAMGSPRMVYSLPSMQPGTF